jgi:alpha-1,3-rhamnosyl/mannosyltransferase
VRVAYDETGLELDAAGSARAARALRAAIDAAGEVDLRPVAQPPWPRGRVSRGLVREALWYPAGIGARARLAGADLLHCPMPLAPPLPTGLPVVVTVHDALPWDHPEWLTRAHAVHARAVLAPALRRAAAVIVSSGFTRERLLARVRGLDAGRVHVVPLGVDARFSPRPGPGSASAPSGGGHLLFVGTLQPRKGLEIALRAFEQLGGDLRLVIAGARGWHDEALLARVAASPAAERIEVAGFVDDDRLVELYRSAACLLFPSLAEGFGFPPLEAMACGTPVVAARAASVPEVVGDAAPLVAPRDPDALAAAVRDVLRDPAPWRAAGLARAAGFSWERCARTIAGVWRAVAASPRRSRRSRR